METSRRGALLAIAATALAACGGSTAQVQTCPGGQLLACVDPGAPTPSGEAPPPTASFHLGSQATLYWKCGNTVVVDARHLPPGATVALTASQADVLPVPSDAGRFTVVPSGTTTTVSASAVIAGQQVALATQTFAVIKPPAPRLQLVVNGKVYGGAGPISKKSNATVRVVPDADFRALFPQDARYTIGRVDLLAQRSLGAPSKVGTFSGTGRDGVQGIPVPLGNKLKQDAPGTKVFFHVDEVVRVSFQNKQVPEALPEHEHYLGAVIK